MQQVPSSAGSPGRPPSSSQQGHGSGPRRSMSSRRSSISREVDPSSPIDDEKGDRAMSRAGRFMRRLSNFPSARSKGSVSLSSPVAEEAPVAAPKRSLTINVGSPAPAAAVPSTPSGPGPSTAAVSDMGDVNVQFPDNLLWKRRNLSLDAQGFLILSASSQNGKVAVGTKRYHLSEFRQPYTPDLEVQELPNSLCLDFVEGGGIQIACEDRLGQIHVLSVLRDAHNGHSTFGQ
ncbi:hypothetical protein ESCO_004423 [Escovopsis weberi]|uniref:Uncharacterized protein n=1 Tax=Escovopsis weberi TaxID=150374 RepID=A0A0N0RTS3_ESCWE|nr:hypothetical protein ESCO_004423 [Escovopsis weberi]